ncbi:MAG: TVP38/TMEM64 family protein [Myxococcales bacterium]|nr:TVP38/TMEM64 family protein [Myxococcales bacterium]
MAVVAILIGLGLVAWHYNMPLAELSALAQQLGTLRLWLLIILFYCAISVLPLPGRDAVKLLGADQLGLGSILAIWLGEMMAAVVSFWLSRVGGYDLVALLAGKRLEMFNRRLHQATWRSILILRLLPVTPYRFFNYAAGLVELRFWAYFAGSLVGILARTAFFQALFVLFASTLKDRGVTLWQLYVFSMIFVPFMLLTWWLWDRRRRKRATTEQPPRRDES